MLNGCREIASKPEPVPADILLLKSPQTAVLLFIDILLLSRRMYCSGRIYYVLSSLFIQFLIRLFVTAWVLD